jgi:ribosomal protein S19
MNTGKAFFGSDRMDFNVVRNPLTVPTVTRQYHLLTDVVDDTIDARVYQGIHFRSADVQGARIGKQVAEWVNNNAFRPVG